MKQKLSLWQFAGFAVVGLLGTILHFLYDWTDQSILIAPFSGVNESTWEHMKLLYFPMLLFALFQRHSFKEQKNFWCIKFLGFSAGLLLIPIIFYTYNGIFGKSPDWFNILIFFLSAAAAYFLEWRLFKKDALPCNRSWLALIAILLIGALFIIFTFITPKIPLFQEPTATIFIRF